MLYFEDFKEGDLWDCGSHTITEEEIIRFAGQFDPQPFHVDPAAAAGSVFGGLIASGWHTVCVFMRLTVDAYLHRAASIGSPGADEVRWLQPVRPGDTLTARFRVTEMRRSRTKPDRGIMRYFGETLNQRGEVVMTLRGLGMFKTRSQG